MQGLSYRARIRIGSQSYQGYAVSIIQRNGMTFSSQTHAQSVQCLSSRENSGSAPVAAACAIIPAAAAAPG